MKNVLNLLAISGMLLGFNQKVFALSVFQVCNFDSDYTLSHVIAAHLGDNYEFQYTQPVTFNANKHCSNWTQYSDTSSWDLWYVSVDNISYKKDYIDPSIGPWTPNGKDDPIRCDIGSGDNEVQLFIKNPIYSHNNHSVKFSIVMYNNGDYMGRICDSGIEPQLREFD